MNAIKKLLEQTRAGLSPDADDVYEYHQSSEEPLLCVALRAAYEAGAALKTVQPGERITQYAVPLQNGDWSFHVWASATARVVDWFTGGGELTLVFATDGGESEPREFKIISTGQHVPCECRYLGLVGGYVLVEVMK